MKNTTDNMNVADIENAIQELNKYAKEPRLEPLISILEKLKKDSCNDALLAQLADTWNNLGIFQGTVLTYVPKFYTWIPDDIFGDSK